MLACAINPPLEAGRQGGIEPARQTWLLGQFLVQTVTKGCLRRVRPQARIRVKSTKKNRHAYCGGLPLTLLLDRRGSVRVFVADDTEFVHQFVKGRTADTEFNGSGRDFSAVFAQSALDHFAFERFASFFEV